MKTSFLNGPVNEGRIVGSEGSLKVECLNNYNRIQRFDAEGRLVQEYPIPDQINGYEYEVCACLLALQQGKTECEEMPHRQILTIMEQMDALRREWGICYPFE